MRDECLQKCVRSQVLFSEGDKLRGFSLYTACRALANKSGRMRVDQLERAFAAFFPCRAGSTVSRRGGNNTDSRGSLSDLLAAKRERETVCYFG